MQSIRIIADDAQKSPIPTLTDLPIEEKELVYSLSFTNSILVNVLSNITGQTVESVAQEVARLSLAHSQKPTKEDVESFIVDLLEVPTKLKNGYVLTELRCQKNS